MFVESEHLTGHLAPVVKCYAHSVVNQVLLRLSDHVHQWNRVVAYHLPLFVRHAGGRTHKCNSVDFRSGIEVPSLSVQQRGTLRPYYDSLKRAKWAAAA